MFLFKILNYATPSAAPGRLRRPSAPPEPAQCHKCHACHANGTSMSPSAAPATQSAAAPRAMNGDQARHQSQPTATSAMPATPNAGRCRQVPRLVDLCVWPRCVWKMACDKVVCDKVVCDKERWCVTKREEVCDKVVCVWQSCVWKMVCDKVVCVCQGGGGEGGGAGYRIKNKNPTQRCGEQSLPKIWRIFLTVTAIRMDTNHSWWRDRVQDSLMVGTHLAVLVLRIAHEHLLRFCHE